MLSESIQQRKKTISPMKNLLLFGPPGNGKTLYAKHLAQFSNMDFALFSGSDVVPLGKSAVQEINHIFDWADSSRNGIILFIDEADALFRKRQNDISEQIRQSINAILARSGTQSYKVMIVVATNQPELLDSALVDRMGFIFNLDLILKMDLPDQIQRQKLLNLYINKYCQGNNIWTSMWRFYMSPLSIFYQIQQVENELKQDQIQNIAQVLDGYSCREIEKFIINCHDTAFNQNQNLQQNIIDRCLIRFQEQHEFKNKWL